MAIKFNGINVERVIYKYNTTERVWSSISESELPFPGYYDITVDVGSDYPISDYLPNPESQGIPDGIIGRVVSIVYGTYYYIVELKTFTHSTTANEVKYNGTTVLKYEWQIISNPGSYDYTYLPTPSYNYLGKVARIQTGSGTKKWVSTTSGSYSVSAHSGYNPPLSSYLPSASNYSVGTRARVQSYEFGTAYYIVEQDISYTYYRCVVV